MKATFSTPSNFWIAQNALTISLNALGNADYVQASVASGAVIMAFIDGIISYDSAHNYKRWNITAYPTVFENKERKYVYARIPGKDNVEERAAMVVYSSKRLSLYGEEVDEKDEIIGEPVVSPSHFFIFLGEISAVHSGIREWVENLINAGKLSTDEYIKEEASAEWKKMFSLDTLTNTIVAHLPFLSAAIRKLKLGLGEKEVDDVKRSIDSDADVPVSDQSITTSKYVNDKFLSKTHDDTAHGKITFDGGLDLGTFSPGLTGGGGHFDRKGNGEMRSLRLWETLEVPELRYNRVSVYIGIRMDTFGGGIIENVVPNPDLSGMGSATLKLEDGEYGAVEEGDLMMGIWHDEKGGNASESVDDHLGNFSFAGFKTVYFMVTKVSGARNEQLEYMLRGRDNGGNGIHPFAGMHIAGRGNVNEGKTQRQAFTYSTTEYSVSLVGVKTWQFAPEHYYEIHGCLDGFQMPAKNQYGEIYLKSFHGYGQVFGNAYLFGEIDKFERAGFKCDIIQSTNGFMTPADLDVVSVRVVNGYDDDVTDQFFIKSLTRNTGDEATDADWNNQFSARYPEGIPNPFELAWSDMGFDLNRPDRFFAIFHLQCQKKDAAVYADAYFDFN